MLVAVCCLLPVVCRLEFVVCRPCSFLFLLIFFAVCLWLVACGLLIVVRYCCLLFCVWRSLLGVWGLVSGVGCLLPVVCGL